MGEEGVNRFQVLCFEQVYRLQEVMEGSVPVHGRGNFPTLDIQLKELVQVVREKLAKDGITVNDIRLNGGAASYILGMEVNQVYNDLDLIFGVDLTNQSDFQKVKNAVLDSLLDFLPEGVNKEKMSTCSLKEAYVQKMVKVCNETDRWSLISLSNNKGKNVELKFVHKMRRQFEFSVDSFQIILDSLMTFYEISQTPMSEHFYPTVVAESVYGNFNVAMYHLNEKFIATRKPEEIRGGGLLKYCNLLVRGYMAAKDMDIKSLERYMCSRFFIDFSDITQQQVKLENYLANHFIGDDHMKYDYLMILYSVVDDSTVCLMNGERRQTLSLIQQLASHVLLEQEQKAFNKQLVMQQFDQHSFPTSFDQQSNLIIDQVFYGPCANLNFPVVAVSSDQYFTTPYTYSIPNSACGSPNGSQSPNGTVCPYCPPFLQCS